MERSDKKVFFPRWCDLPVPIGTFGRGTQGFRKNLFYRNFECI
jgi:hypothetical protein